jgi:fucose permease
MLQVIWFVLTSPFRLVGWVVGLFGRLVGVVLGFALMVVGVALCAASWLMFGLPLFVIGLIVTLRSLG